MHSCTLNPRNNNINITNSQPKSSITKLTVVTSSATGLNMRVNSIQAMNSMATVCFTIRMVNYVILEVGKVILFVVLEFYIMKIR